MVSSFLLYLLLLFLHFVVLLEAFAMMGSGCALPRGDRLPLLPNARSWRRRLLYVHVYMYWRMSTLFWSWIALFGSPAPGTWIVRVQSPLADNVLSPSFGILAAG